MDLCDGPRGSSNEMCPINLCSWYLPLHMDSSDSHKALPIAQ